MSVYELHTNFIVILWAYDIIKQIVRNRFRPFLYPESFHCYEP